MGYEVNLDRCRQAKETKMRDAEMQIDGGG
jgi:hypothetical protein